MKRTTIILVLLLAVLGSFTAWYLTKNTGKPKATNLTSDMDFAVDPDVVYKIFVADREGNKTTLKKVDGEWLLEGTKKIRPSALGYILDVIKNVEVKYRPAKPAYKKIINDLATYGIEVELYDKEDGLLKNYYVGGVDEEGDGNFMIMAESNEPFVTHMKNFVGGFRTRFAMAGDEWRDRSVFAENPDDIVEVSIDYPRQKNQSFKFLRDGNSFDVQPFHKTTPIIDKKILKGKPEQFLMKFESILAEDFQNDYILKDYAKALVPFAVVSLKTKDGEEKSVRFIPYQKADEDGKPIKQNKKSPVVRFHADCSWGDFMVVQYPVFEEIFWPYDAFF